LHRQREVLFVRELCLAEEQYLVFEQRIVDLFEEQIVDVAIAEQKPEIQATSVTIPDGAGPTAASEKDTRQGERHEATPNSPAPVTPSNAPLTPAIPEKPEVSRKESQPVVKSGDKEVMNFQPRSSEQTVSETPQTQAQTQTKKAADISDQHDDNDTTQINQRYKAPD
jgi:hypothetical protein